MLDNIALSHQTRWVEFPVIVCIWQKEMETEIGGSFSVNEKMEKQRACPVDWSDIKGMKRAEITCQGL